MDALGLLLAVCVAVTLALNCVSAVNDTLRPFKRRRTLHWCSFASWSLTALVAGVQVHLHVGSQTTDTSGKQIKVDADIAGQGVRPALYLPALIGILPLLRGCWITDETGTKELGTANLINLSYVVLDTFKATFNWYGDLNFQERVAVIISIDILCLGTWLSFSDKNALSSRWFIRIACTLQLLALAFIALILYSISRISGKECYVATWYGPISSCTGVAPSVWLFLAARFVGAISDAHNFAWTHAIRFDRGKKDWEEDPRVYPQYGLLPSTSFSNCWTMIPCLIVSICSLERLVHGLDCGKLSDWGQSAALIVSCTAGLHCGYINYLGFKSRKEGRGGLNSSPNVAFSKDLRLGQIDAARQIPNFWRPVGEQRTPEMWTSQLRTSITDGDLVSILDALKHVPNQVNLAAADGETALLAAVQIGNLSVVQRLKAHYEATSEWDKQDRMSSAISRAAYLGKLEIVDYLLSSGDDPMAPDRDGNTPLQLACEMGQDAAVQRLCTARDGSQNYIVAEHLRTSDGHGCLRKALQNNHDSTAKCIADILNDPSLICRRTLIQAIKDRDIDVVKNLKRLRLVDFSSQDPDSTIRARPIHWAATSGRIEVLKEVIEAPRVDFMILDDQGHDALWWAVLTYSDLSSDGKINTRRFGVLDHDDSQIDHYGGDDISKCLKYARKTCEILFHRSKVFKETHQRSVCAAVLGAVEAGFPQGIELLASLGMDLFTIDSGRDGGFQSFLQLVLAGLGNQDLTLTVLGPTGWELRFIDLIIARDPITSTKEFDNWLSKNGATIVCAIQKELDADKHISRGTDLGRKFRTSRFYLAIVTRNETIVKLVRNVPAGPWDSSLPEMPKHSKWSDWFIYAILDELPKMRDSIEFSPVDYAFVCKAWNVPIEDYWPSMLRHDLIAFVRYMLERYKLQDLETRWGDNDGMLKAEFRDSTVGEMSLYGLSRWECCQETIDLVLAAAKSETAFGRPPSSI